MAEKLEFSGERFTPECEREISYEHIHRYAFAALWCKDARVLDAACGEGYGSSLLAQSAASVTGVDISAEAVQHAAQRYTEQESLDFRVADCTQLPFDSDQFDMVVSFETLEHLKQQEAMLSEFRRVLNPEGFLILSSPDKAVYSEQRGFVNEFHVRELYREELEKLIAVEFPVCRLLGQKLMFHSAIWSLEDIGRVGLQSSNSKGEIIAGRIGHAPMYFIALCAQRDECLPRMSEQLWLFDDDSESVYRHYYHEIRKNMAAGGILADRDAELESLKQRLEGQRKPWWRRLLGRA